MVIPDTARLTFSLMSRDDALHLFELDQDVEVMRYINGGTMTSLAQIHSVFVPRMESYTNLKEGWGLWKVSLKTIQTTPVKKTLQQAANSSDTFLGWILVRPMDFFSEVTQWDNLEIGWRFKQSNWGQGYATEAAVAVMNVVSQANKISKVSAIAMEGNVGSINIMKKLGMNYLKTEVHQDPLGDMNVVYYEKSII